MPIKRPICTSVYIALVEVYDMKQSLLKIFLLSTSLLPLCGVAQAQEKKTDEFELGTITIVGHRKQVGEVGLGQTGLPAGDQGQPQGRRALRGSARHAQGA